MSGRVAVVTGANRGLGYHIAMQIIASGLFETVILACRDPKLGAAAARTLGGTFLPLDLADEGSIQRFADTVARQYGRCDCLVNNAGVGSWEIESPEKTRWLMITNFYGTAALTQALLPLLRKGASPRLVNVASTMGKLRIVAPKLRRRFAAGNLTLPGLVALVQEFEDAVERGAHHDEGWGHCDYGISKLALIAATKIWARENPALRANACCPGFCATDMSEGQGQPVPIGARNAVMLALLDDDGPSGTFWEHHRLSSW